MVYWGPNLDHVYYMHFCPKKLKLPKDYNFQNVFHLGMVGIHFFTLPHLLVLESWDTLTTHSHFHALTFIINSKLES